MENLKICKHSNGCGYCSLCGEYCVEGPCKEEDLVEYAPVVHGRWIKHDGYTECSECDYWYDSPENEDAGDRSNYCPNCGARMDLEDEP